MNKIYKYDAIALIIIVLFIIIKLPYLSIAYFWDEAWSYVPGVRSMLEHQISIFPNNTPIDATRGHPLLFYALSATWLKIFGTSYIAHHTLPLLFSVTLLATVYFISKQLFDYKVALLAISIVASQAFFVAQSTMMLPEVLIALQAIIAIYSFYSEKVALYIISAAAMLYTKESGFVLITACNLFCIISCVNKKNTIYKTIKKLVWVNIPVLIVSVFYIWQKLKYGWFLFPEHVGMMELKLNNTVGRAKVILDFFFLQQRRYILSILLIAMMMIAIFIKNKNGEPSTLKHNKNIKPLFVLFAIFSIGYIIFSGINFFTMRYILALLPIYAIVFAYFLNYYATKLNKNTWILIAIVILAFQGTGTFKHNNTGDCDMGYADAVWVHQQLIAYCEQQQWQEEVITTDFLTGVNLTNPYSGYLTNKKFNKVSSTLTDSTSLLIFSNMEFNDYYNSMKKQKKVNIIKRFEKENAWSEIYKIEK